VKFLGKKEGLKGKKFNGTPPGRAYAPQVDRRALRVLINL